MTKLTCITGVVLLSASAALAVMPPKVYREAARNAAYHLQVKVLKVVAPKTTPGPCSVTAKVVRIFRNRTKKLSNGRKISFTVACKKQTDRTMPGGTIWTSLTALTKAKYLEVALDGTATANRFSVARYNSSIINKPSQKPQWGFPFHKRPAPKK